MVEWGACPDLRSPALAVSLVGVRDCSEDLERTKEGRRGLAWAKSGGSRQPVPRKPQKMRGMRRESATSKPDADWAPLCSAALAHAGGRVAGRKPPTGGPHRKTQAAVGHSVRGTRSRAPQYSDSNIEA